MVRAMAASLMPQGERKYGRRADLLVGIMISIVIAVLALAVFLHWPF
jgi:hypothetical protein